MNKKNWIASLAIAFAIILLLNLNAYAAPNGATISFNSTETANTSIAGNRTDIKGSINTVRINTVQQNTRWKAYVGNVSGRLTLDDASTYTIYDWSTGATKGEVYASRSSSIAWGNITCLNAGNLSAEQSALGITASSTDSIQSTFNWSGHRSFDVGLTTMTGCNSTATYTNDTNPGQSGSAHFQEALLTDYSSVIYASIVNASGQGYNNGSLYDFQMIVADNVTSGSPPITYFFWIELI